MKCFKGERAARGSGLPDVGRRRGFISRVALLGLAAAAYAVPVVGGLLAFLDPLRRKGAAGRLVRVASLDGLPEDGTPQKVAVVAERVDAWRRTVEPVGAVYLRRTAEDEVVALQVVCPHAGCTVEYRDAASGQGGEFFCPCHRARFDLAGKRLDKVSQSPRDLDPLEVQIRNGTEVWVRFQKFQFGTSKRVPVG
ncbi:MAG TPA: Rieske (2Fe-2S) protein [Planctomycetaceae bacterium]|nr:Rieske (2Fe-2S) protein [Planctomycetaceae bacterium]HIQ21711.1 Rieske (2Fe-2S) protein [Planctomycetota bacterium]